MNGKKLCRELTRRTDRLITDLTNGLGANRRFTWCIVAVGGYGRSELCPFSDIDLLLLADSRTHQDVMAGTLQKMLYPLWDKGYTVGYSVRTIAQALHDTRDDFFFRTSLLDARYLCGRPDLFDELLRSCSRDRHLRDSGKFIQCLDEHILKRHGRYGDASYNLEPDIKEGMGSLRDYHCLMWINKVLGNNPALASSSLCLNPMDSREIEEASDSLLNIRYHLHTLAGRKADRLSFEYQAPLAELLGYKDDGTEKAEELLMRSFHCSALSIKSITGSVRAQLKADLFSRFRAKPRMLDRDFLQEGGLISFVRPGDVPAKPLLLMNVFEHMARHGLLLSLTARDTVRGSLASLEAARQDDQCKRSFMRTLMSPGSLEALTSMLETGVLERFIPEFAAIKGRTQADIYHTYTTDLHSIRTVRELHGLRDTEHDAFSRVRDVEALYLAAFLHDIGKGRGRPHAAVGASIARGSALRLGLSEEQADLVQTLVRHHLLLPDTAYRSDLSEEKVAVECARRARDEQTLAMLYLLSIADSRATGPRAWNDWKARLLNELFSKALHSLQRGILRDPHTMIVLEERWKQLIREIPENLGGRRGASLWVLPQAYVIHTPADLIKRHILFSSELSGPEDIRLDISDKGDHARLTMIARDRRGLFALLAGILTMNHLDVLAAQVFTWLNGTAVDTFHVVTPWPEYSRWEKIRKNFSEACTGKLDMDAGVAGTRPLRTEPAIRSSSPSVITLDNSSSDFFTLIDVHAPRKFGLLYRVTRAMTSLNLNIHRAFLSHTGDPCTDVFYVVDELGEKVMDQDMIRQVEQVIADAAQ